MARETGVRAVASDGRPIGLSEDRIEGERVGAQRERSRVGSLISISIRNYLEAPDPTYEQKLAVSGALRALGKLIARGD